MAKMISVIMFILAIFILILLSFYEDKINYKSKKRIILFSTFVISIIGAFRTFGSDLENYREIFNSTNLTLNYEYFINALEFRIEPIFMILISIIKGLGFGFKTFLFISLIIPIDR